MSAGIPNTSIVTNGSITWEELKLALVLIKEPWIQYPGHLLTSPLAVEPFGLGNCCPLITCTEEKRAQIHVTKSGIDIFSKKRWYDEIVINKMLF